MGGNKKIPADWDETITVNLNPHLTSQEGRRSKTDLEAPVYQLNQIEQNI